MGLISDGYSEIDAQERSNLCYLICLMHLIKSRAVTNRVHKYLNACATSPDLPSNISLMRKGEYLNFNHYNSLSL